MLEVETGTEWDRVPRGLHLVGGKKKSDREACFLPVSSPGASSAGSASGAKGVGISWGYFRPPGAPRKSAAFSIWNLHARASGLVKEPRHSPDNSSHQTQTFLV